MGKYDHEIEELDGTKRNVPVNEFICAIAASKGQRGGGNDGAGIRMDGKKFMLIRPSPEVDHGGYLSCSGGGATVASTEKIVIIGIWDKEEKMSNGNL